jgi:hypothetical protein
MRDDSDQAALQLDPELVAIAQQADQALNGQAAPLLAAAEPEPAPDQAGQIGGLLTMGVMMAAPALPFLPQCYTPEVIGNISTAAAAVCEKHGWNVGDVMSPELVLAVAVLPPSLQAVVMFKQWKAEQAAAREAAQRAAYRSTDPGQAGNVYQLPQLPAPAGA